MSTEPAREGTRPPPQDEGPDLVEDREFLERLERLTWLVARALMVGIPVAVLVLFAFLPVYDDVGAIGPVILAVLVAAGAVAGVERLRGRRGRAAGASGPPRAAAPARPHRRLLWIALALFAIFWIVFVYVIAGSA